MQISIFAVAKNKCKYFLNMKDIIYIGEKCKHRL